MAPGPVARVAFAAIRLGCAARWLIKPSNGHASRQSLEIYSRLALADAQHIGEHPGGADALAGFPGGQPTGPRSQAAVDTAPVTPAAPRRSKTTSRRANSDSSRETATRSPTRLAARAESGRPATSTASSRSSIGSRQPASTAPPPPALPAAPLPAPEHMFDSVVHPSDQTGTFPMNLLAWCP